MHQAIQSPASSAPCHAHVAGGLVDLGLQHRTHVPRLNADHWQARFGENAVKPLRQRSGFQPNSLEAIGVVCQHLQESFTLGTRLLTFDKLRHDPQSPETYGASVTYDMRLHRQPAARALQSVAAAMA